MMETSMTSEKSRRKFAVICVLGCPGAGKGALCTHLAKKYNLVHYSVGDNLRTFVKQNPRTPLAIRIQTKLDHQGFLSPDDLDPLISQGIKNASYQDGASAAGILIDGYPRCAQQLASIDKCESEVKSKLASSEVDSEKEMVKKQPDVVLILEVDKEKAKTRYIQRGRDSNDNAEKFESRYVEYQNFTVPVANTYRERAVAIDIDANGTREEIINVVSKQLEANKLWQVAVVGESAAL